MDPILLFIDSLQLWHFFIVAILLLGLSALIGDTDILPWISFSLDVSQFFPIEIE